MMKWSNPYCLFLCLAAMFSSCEDYRLIDEKEDLKGEWVWVETYLEDIGSGPTSTYLTPQRRGFEASMKFEGRNKLYLFRDGEHYDCDRIKFVGMSTDYGSTVPIDIQYSFEFNGEVVNDGELLNFGCYFNKGSRDTLYVRDYPYDRFYSEGSSEVRYNKYVRAK